MNPRTEAHIFYMSCHVSISALLQSHMRISDLTPGAYASKNSTTWTVLHALMPCNGALNASDSQPSPTSHLPSPRKNPQASGVGEPRGRLPSLDLQSVRARFFRTPLQGIAAYCPVVFPVARYAPTPPSLQPKHTSHSKHSFTKYDDKPKLHEDIM